jgi:membrane protease YdiL (CAAX protease family)
VGDQAPLIHLLTAGLIVAVAAGGAALAAYLVLRSRKESLFPPPRRWIVGWNGWVVLAAFFAYYAIPQFLLPLLESAGFFQMVYGREFPSPPERGQDATAAQKTALIVRSLWTYPLAVPLIVVAVVALRRSGQPTPRDAGIRPVPNIVIAFLGWLVLTPLTFIVYGAVIWLMESWTGRPPEPHPLTRLAPYNGPLELLLFAAQATVLAPVLEELLCRGTLLPWLLQRPPRRPQRGQSAPVLPPFRADLVVVGAAVALALALKLNDFDKARTRGDSVDWFMATAPAGFMLLLVPLYWIVPRWTFLGRRLRMPSVRAGRAVWASAMVFAAAHSNVWPSPVPLFVLGLGLGYIAYRTRSIVAPILIHGLFNAVSVIAVLWEN